MRRKFAVPAVHVRDALVRLGEFIVRINLTFNFPRLAYSDASAICRDALRSETLRFRIIRSDSVADNLFVVRFYPAVS